jgi:hypothetical protein
MTIPIYPSTCRTSCPHTPPKCVDEPTVSHHYHQKSILHITFEVKHSVGLNKSTAMCTSL